MSESQPLVAVPEDYAVEFDREHGFNYLFCVGGSFWTALTCGCGLPCLPCIYSWLRLEMDSQKCTVTDRRVVFESGWLNRSTKSIPLDRIQDINIQKGCLQRLCDVECIEIQTAGAGSPLPEAYLIAPVNAAEVRDAIMDRRDRLVLGGYGSRSFDLKAAMQVDGSASALGADVRELKDAVLRIEQKLVNHGVL